MQGGAETHVLCLQYVPDELTHESRGRGARSKVGDEIEEAGSRCKCSRCSDGNMKLRKTRKVEGDGTTVRHATGD